MATKSVMTKEQRQQISDALAMKLASEQRAARSAKSATIEAAYEAEAVKTSQLINLINTGELEL